MLLSAVSILARTSCSSITSGLVTSCAAAFAFISYQRWSRVKPLSLGASMVILVPEITSLPASIGSRTRTFSGSSQLTSMVAPRISDDRHRDRHAQQPHPPAVARGARERAPLVARVR